MLSIRDGPDGARVHVTRLHLGEPGLKSAMMSKNYGSMGVIGLKAKVK